ncbi:Na/Pi symporter [Myxococcus sp. SDU36]|uniref:Na/Pi cotransporter family protein n=1 Tax=Myxococcus sp. SDU36 TaxID=2831967 RepID=UPI002543686E|nr:Na/Pi symporter [Myxococcus sp. SDU36]WIG98848.1 Na/Pi symporter [Myxococcus sp. SDU36]
MLLTSLINFVGGIALFLLGMRLMSDGLKVAAGGALRELLARATGSRLRALATGVLVTALVQSSSAVIFATIGFVNAGLLNLGQAVGVVFGANLGTTLTSWIVALVGFDIDLKVLAMPAVAVGMALWLAGRRRGPALGQALVGFGVFFLGLDVLKGAFADVDPAGVMALADAAGSGPLRLLVFTVVGIVLTLLMQSSSAALAVTLTAAASGMLPASAAAAMVVGANIGTTSTAVFATLGATAAARRTAIAHVVFNVVAGIAALLALPWLLQASMAITGDTGGRLSTTLAVFHTLSNLLGIALVLPFTTRLVAMLEHRFGAREAADPAMPRYLDRSAAATPRLAIDALAMELGRLAALASEAALDARNGKATPERHARLARQAAAVERLGQTAIEFVSRLDSGGDPVVEDGLPEAVRVVHACKSLAALALELADRPAEPAASAQHDYDAFDACVERVLAPAPDETMDATGLDETALEQAYERAKSALLVAGRRGEIPATQLVGLLDRASLLRRMGRQAFAGARGRRALRLDAPAPTADTEAA